jgi:hypothetical protein
MTLPDHREPYVAENCHLFRFGFDWEHATSTTLSIFQDPAQLTLWSPAQARAGRYFDPVGSANPLFLGNERFALLPLGTGRVVVTDSLLCNGRSLNLRQQTPFSGADLLACLPAIRAEQFAALNPANRDFTFRNIDRNKVAENLVDPDFSTPSAVHLGLGVQRQLARDFAISADFVWRRFSDTFITGIDYNRWNSMGGPVIRACTSTERNDIRATCSNGSITFDTTIGRARYKGLLIRADKRFSRRTQFLVSYALGSYVGTNGTAEGAGFNNDNWFENYGPLPTDLRHVVNTSGYVELPWQFQLAFSVSAYSRPPFSVVVNGVAFNGDGTHSDLLPGTSVNQFNRGLDADDLLRFVNRYNQEWAGKPLCCNQGAAPLITLPADYSFNDGFFTQDVRLGRTFRPSGGRTSVQLFAEIFKLLNTPNLIQYLVVWRLNSLLHRAWLGRIEGFLSCDDADATSLP